MKYIVGFSWWVDSTYIWWKLRKLDHNVLFVNLKNTIWNNKCCEIPTKLYSIANNIWINLLIIDVTNEFKQLVIENFISSYINWITPNPCINCNELVRFKILNQIRIEQGFDYITTGHYADTISINWNNYLITPKDTKKDQTYMIYRISNINQNGVRLLNFVKFVLWEQTKEQVKKEYKHNIWDIIPRDSQNICFIPDDDYSNYIKQNTNSIIKPWKVVDINWNYICDHKWFLYYTIWQRANCFIQSKDKIYIIDINYKTNQLTIWEQSYLFKSRILLMDYFFHDKIIESSDVLYWKIRYHHNIQQIKNIRFNNSSLEIEFIEPVKSSTSWQHCVLYKKFNDRYIVVWWWVISSKM